MHDKKLVICENYGHFATKIEVSDPISISLSQQNLRCPFPYVIGFLSLANKMALIWLLICLEIYLLYCVGDYVTKQGPTRQRPYWAINKFGDNWQDSNTTNQSKKKNWESQKEVVGWFYCFGLYRPEEAHDTWPFTCPTSTMERPTWTNPSKWTQHIKRRNERHSEIE